MTHAPIDFIVPIALKDVMAVLTPEFTRATGHLLAITYKLNPEVPEHIASGVAWDIAITNPQYIEQILAAKQAAADSHRAFGRSPLALAVRGESVGPTPQTPLEIADALRTADSIAITGAGTSGEQFRALAATLGVWDEITHRVRAMAGGGPMSALLAGDVAMAALPLSNIAPVHGVFAVARCPIELGVHIDLSLCLSPDASAAAHQLADWLVDAARDATLDRLGAWRYVLNG